MPRDRTTDRDQHASLSTLEAYCIQFAVLRQARGLEPKDLASHPRRHNFPTFESHLPLSRGFEAVTPNPDHLKFGASRADKDGKPDLICTFCIKINGFGTIIGYWSHLFHKHEEVADEKRLQEIRRSASLWQRYWSQKKQSRNAQATVRKFEQVQGEGFSWDVVGSWQLRR